MADYFVKVADGKGLRKGLLESSKLSITILKQEHKVRELRKRRHELTKQVRDELKELTFLLGSLEKQLPVMTKKELEELQPERAKKAVKKASKKKTAAKKSVKKVEESRVSSEEDFSSERSKLERLEESLDTIEERLKKI